MPLSIPCPACGAPAPIGRYCTEDELERLAQAHEHVWKALELLVDVRLLDDTMKARVVLSSLSTLLEERLRALGCRDGAPVYGFPPSFRRWTLARWEALHKAEQERRRR